LSSCRPQLFSRRLAARAAAEARTGGLHRSSTPAPGAEALAAAPGCRRLCSCHGRGLPSSSSLGHELRSARAPSRPLGSLAARPTDPSCRGLAGGWPQEHSRARARVARGYRAHGPLRFAGRGGRTETPAPCQGRSPLIPHGAGAPSPRQLRKEGAGQVGASSLSRLSCRLWTSRSQAAGGAHALTAKPGRAARRRPRGTRADAEEREILGAGPTSGGHGGCRPVHPSRARLTP
jgi:hypothetical protein